MLNYTTFAASQPTQVARVRPVELLAPSKLLFEWLHWFAYVAWALPYDWGWLSLMAPVVMLYLLFSVTGIPYAEKRALQSRGDEYTRIKSAPMPFSPFSIRQPT